MATRSDFAQKLLTDLRMRKERMSTPASHNTSNTKGMTRDSYGNPSQNYAGFRQTKSSNSVGERPTKSQRRCNNGAKSLTIQESTKQLVQYKGDQISKQNGDLSRALAFAFGNNKSFTKVNNSSSNNRILNFLHGIGRRALDIGKMERRNITSINKPSNQIINVSSIHINEISKGIQKLNKILGAYSNSITFDGHSIEIGRELLKGAMDLEEMLTKIHEGSNQLVNPRRKTRIKLLDENGEEQEEEEEGASVPQKKLVERPRFSFDKPSRVSRDTKHAIKSDPKPSVLDLKYTTEDKNLFTKQPSSTSNDVMFHRRAASCSPDFRPQHGKMPNVIAKLMGLEEVPQNVNFESTPRHSNENRNGKIVENMTKNAEYTAPTAYARKLTQNADGFKFQNTKTLLKDFDKVGVTKSVSGPQVDEEFPRSNESTHDLQVKMRRKGIEKHEKDVGVEKGQAKRVVNRDHKDAEARKKHLQEKINTDREKKPRVEKSEQIIVGKKTSKDFHDKKPYKSSTNSKHETEILRNGRSMNLTANTRKLMFLNSCRSETPNDTVPKTTKISGVFTPPIKEDKPINMVSIERESPRGKDKVISKRKETRENTAVALKDQTSSLQKEKQLEFRGAENLGSSSSKEAKMSSISPNTIEATAMVLIEDFALDKEASERSSPIVVQDLSTLDETSQDTANKISIDPIDDEDQLANSIEETGRRSSKLELISIKGKVITKRKESRENTAVALKDQTSFLQKEKQLKFIGGGETSSNSNSKEAKIRIISPNKLEERAMVIIEDFALVKEASELPSPIVIHELSTFDENSQDMAPKISIDLVDEDQLATSIKETGKRSSKLELLSIKEIDELSGKEADVLQSPIAFSDLPTVDKNSQEMTIEISISPIANEDQLPGFKEGTCQESQKIEIYSENGCNEASLDNSNTQQHEQKENQIPEYYTSKLLIESEFHLKQTLLKSWPFLNTAHETFNLSVAVDFLNPRDDIIQDEDNKLILDVSHELTRKKGKILDLSLYPSMKISNFSVKIKSFDDLVKQLYTDFKKLTIIYEGTNEEQDSAEYIQEILERDIENRDTDVNAMWDMGWNDILFGIIERYELMKDVEMYLINMMIEEIAQELLNLDFYISEYLI